MAVDTTLPKQLQADLEAAEAIQAQLAGTAQEMNTEPQQPQEPTQSQTQPEQQPEPTPAATEDSFEARYNILKGKYSAEVPRLSEQLREAKHMISTLEGQVQELAKKPEPKDDPLVTSKDEEAFGADLIDLSRRVVREEISQVLKRITTIERAVSGLATVSQKVDRIEEVNAQSAEERFWSSVNSLVPDWEVVDNDQRWIEFLDTRARGSAKTYRQLASEAIEAGNAEVIAELVTIWKDVAGITADKEKKTQRDRELASQAQPGKSKVTHTEAPAQNGRIWTWAEYEKVYSPNLSREYTKAQVEAMQAEAEKAYLEGRIR